MAQVRLFRDLPVGVEKVVPCDLIDFRASPDWTGPTTTEEASCAVISGTTGMGTKIEFWLHMFYPTHRVNRI